MRLLLRYCRNLGTGNLDRTRRQMAAHDVGEWPVEDLPETITLGTGELRTTQAIFWLGLHRLFRGCSLLKT